MQQGDMDKREREMKPEMGSQQGRVKINIYLDNMQLIVPKIESVFTMQ